MTGLPTMGVAMLDRTIVPAVQRWHERMNELEAWREPFPEIAVAA